MYDLEEQEQIDAIKGWWQKNRLALLALIAAGVLGYGGMTGYKSWKANRADQAAAQYQTFQLSLAAGDPIKVHAAAQVIEAASPSSPYAARAAMAAGQALAGASKTAESRVEYQWVIDHSSEVQLQSIARIRLAGVLADAQNYADALTTLGTGVDPAFAALAGDRRGDILLAQGKLVDARAAYRSALDGAAQNNPLRQVLQTKVDALGAEK